MEIGGTIAGANYDQLLVTGDVLVESDVRIAFINDFLPGVGDEFDLVGASTFNLTGQVIFLNAPPNFQYSTSFADGAFTVTINVSQNR